MSTGKYKWIRSIYTRHLLLAVVITIILLFIIGSLLRYYTRHGDILIVPDFAGFTMAELEDHPGVSRFKLQVVDSIYDPEKKKGSVAFQDPPPASIVKENRTIYLTLVAILPEQVRMPSLIDMTLRQATAVLETYGLKTGRLDYIPDIAKNAVLRQRYKGMNIEPGTWIEKGSRIDLVCGQGIGSGSVHLPFLLGMPRRQAIETIESAFLVVGKEVFEDGKDTLHARVYRQSPAAESKNNVKPGETIDLWYRSDKKFDFETYLKQYKLDSIRESMGNDSLVN